MLCQIMSWDRQPVLSSSGGFLCFTNSVSVSKKKLLSLHTHWNIFVLLFSVTVISCCYKKKKVSMLIFVEKICFFPLLYFYCVFCFALMLVYVLSVCLFFDST